MDNDCNNQMDEQFANQSPGMVRQSNSKSDTLGTISLVLGITALVLTFCCPVLDILLAIVAIICGIIAHNDGQNYGKIGAILGAVAILLNILVFLGIFSLAILDSIL